MEKITPLKRFFKLLEYDKKDIYYIYILAILSAAVSLSLPLGIQAIINLILAGRVSSSWILLVVIVLIGILMAGFFQILQLSLAETIQQRLFVRASSEFAYRFPRLKMSQVNAYYPPELVNRFFDVLNVQKGLPKLLKDLSTASIQIVFGLVLLSFYHPFFVFFGFFLLVYLILIFVYTGPKGLEYSLMESKYKYKTVFWLEEIARVLPTFKLAGGSSIIKDKLYPYVEGYLTYRKKHFKVLLFQFGNMVAFKTIITGGLLIIGGILVMDRQISLGQFIATEIIIIIILNSVEKILTGLETVYDVLTGVEKLGQVTDLELDYEEGYNFQKFEPNGPGAISVNLTDVSYSFAEFNRNLLRDINLKIKAGERICLSGTNSSGKSALLHVIAGLYPDHGGTVTFNSVVDINIEPFSLRKRIGDNLSDQNIFEGTIEENLIMGRSYVDLNYALKLAEEMGLKRFIETLPKGLKTELLPNDRRLPNSALKKILLVRSLLGNPGMLLLEDILSELEPGFCNFIAEYITSKEKNWTLVAISNDYNFAQKCDRTLIMEGGKIIAEGPVDELIKKDEYKSLFRFSADGLAP